ncbi:response regulator transcription factor [Clostridiaceae bacterium M8S5]|nr:response regulator transcription factor [Clostridiaceae bacterium M8S5]
MNILLLEDEDSIRSFIKLNLSREGYKVYEAINGEQAISIIKNEIIDIAILDIMVPTLNGIEVLKNIRKTDKEIGVIMLSAKSLQEDKIEGLSHGADDYVTKPFSPKELILRIKSLSRRVKISNQATIKTKRFVLIIDERELYKDGLFISTTQTEFEIVKYFLENQNKVLSKNNMLDHIWGKNYFGSLNTLDVNVSRLRRKIEKDPSNPMHIKTVWGYGYKWEDE